MSIAPTMVVAPDLPSPEPPARHRGLPGSEGPATTFQGLTLLAAESIQDAAGLLRAASVRPHLDASVEGAYRELLSALDQLGTTLLDTARAPRGRPFLRPSPGGRGSDATVVLDLRSVARPWDGDAALLPWGSSTALLRAAALVRAAADLWSTHWTSDGTPRTPQGARLRQSGVLRAARSQWRSLVHETAALADPISAAQGLTPEVVSASKALACATSRSSSRPERAGNTDELGVARPGVRLDAGAHVELHDRIARLELIAWTGWRRQDTPAPVHRVIAECGWIVARTSAELAARPCCGRQLTAAQLRRATEAAEAAAAWRELALALRDLRTLHGALTALAHEPAAVRAIVTRSCGDASPARRRMRDRGTGHEPGCRTLRSRLVLDEATARLLRAAEWNRRSLGVAHLRGDVLIRGRAMPAAVLTRRPDLVRAKVEGTVAPLPAAMARHVDGAFRRVLTASGTLDVPGDVPEEPVA